MAKKSKKQSSRETQQSSEASKQNVDVLAEEVSEGKLLSSQEHGLCVRISEGDTIHSQRAQALLAIDEGASQRQAAQRAGLTRGQVKYWLGKYRKMRLDIFPESILVEAGAGLVESQAETPEVDAVSDVGGGKVGKSKAKKSKKKKSKPKKSKKKVAKPRTKKKSKKSKKKKGKGKKKKKNKKKSA